uniref:Uncharacterized protein n=1 Tax=Octopus bimaculoides TaxID=37653 RepID=A0A0L8G0F8_OCTBM
MLFISLVVLCRYLSCLFLKGEQWNLTFLTIDQRSSSNCFKLGLVGGLFLDLNNLLNSEFWSLKGGLISLLLKKKACHLIQLMKELVLLMSCLKKTLLWGIGISLREVLILKVSICSNYSGCRFYQ